MTICTRRLQRFVIKEMVEEVVLADRTVYLKESTRALLRRCFIEEECERILELTLDMDGNPYKQLKSAH